MREYLEYLEIPIVEYCNLNCKGCSHFSPLATKDDYMTLQEIQSDLTRLKELVPNIYKIRLLGGEPLLHPELFEILYAVRRVYPFADIRIVSNGLLISKMDNEIFRAIKENGISFDISMYPPTVKCWGNIKDILDKFGIDYVCTEPITKFRRRMSLNYRNDIERSYKECVVGNKCNCLYKGRIAACPAPFVVRHFNKHFNHQIEAENDWLDIYNKDLTTNSLIEFVNSPLGMCGYCVQPDEFDWESKPCQEESDWVIE